MSTYTDENGEFTLYSNDENIHFEISAPGYTKAKFNNSDLKYHNVDGDECDSSDLQNVDLEYQKISYLPFLKNDTIFFEFKPELFDKARFVTDMGVIKLKKIK